MNPPQVCRDNVDADLCYHAGTPLFWEQACISYSVSGLGSPALGLDYSAAEGIVATAFSHWITAACADGAPSIAVMSYGPLLCQKREYNPSGPNANGILFRDDQWAYDQLAIALTTVSFDVNSGKIFGADMEINTLGWSNSLTPLSLEYVITHEAGHFLGLAHTPDESAVMFAHYSLAQSTPPALQPDDVAGICAVYPPTRVTPATCNFEPENGLALDCGGNVEASCNASPRHGSRGTAPGWLALLLATAFALRKRTAKARAGARRAGALAPSRGKH